jgi:hypothetical protein
LKEHWGVDYSFIPLHRGKSEEFEAGRAENRSDLPLPDDLEWHSALIFTNLSAAWQTIYARGTNPVVIERKVGRGTLVMATDSYYLSNEALLKDRQAGLLSWLIGPSRCVVFDEAHFGIVESGGVAVLLRKYRLEWLVAGLVLLAGLFIWKNSLSFVPLPASRGGEEFVAGKDAAAGFVNLLRRNIAPGEVLNVCFAEWTKSLRRAGTHTITRVDEAQAAIEAENKRSPKARDAVRTYREICRILKTRKN